ncbi:hypothetical protein DXG03_000105 [Asterophora parasitica]|uniref:Uncharacterized protein n=1 Tax=Asterophora parasitica TaxID=117018 RepID=A0A9P7GKN3_9AGAR|nr:hypothetical protein DXG03_000105 [Asterophora parasitica]
MALPHTAPRSPHALRTSHTRRMSFSEFSNMSVVSMRAVSLDVCEYVYGDSMVSTDTVNRFYEPNAKRVQTAGPLFHGMRVWTEMGDICENESFDGHRKTIAEHTLNILLLPGIHCQNHRPQPSTDSLVSTLDSPPPSLSLPRHPSSPSLRIPGTSVLVPSPLHFQLHIITRLSFNEQGRVTHHRDFWDVKDVIGLVPGVSLAQWIGTRLAALGLSYLGRLWARGISPDVPEQAADPADLESGTSYMPSRKNALGLEGV